MSVSFTSIPEYAVLGHPNEGKSSLVSTLSEDDSVRISPWPGETTECRAFPVKIDGLEILRFIDTPGFQTPQKTLAWFENHPGQGLDKVKAFISENRGLADFKDECELMAPLARGAGIIFVVDGSRPIRSSDRAEMAILEQTGLPRMAVINNKVQEPDFSTDWIAELKQHVHHVTVFNTHTASFKARIALLSELKTIDRLNEKALSEVIRAFEQDWTRRNTLTAERIIDLLDRAMNHTVKSKTDDSTRKDYEKKHLKDRWTSDIRSMEHETHEAIRALYRHNIFNLDLPAHSHAATDLFDRETWKVLGLSRGELVASAAVAGAASAVTVDLAFAGHSLGLFALLGGAAGACSALMGANRIGRTKVLGRRLGAYTLKVGPVRNLQFMMVLLDRALIFHSHIINWTHGRRDGECQKSVPEHETASIGLVSSLDPSQTRTFAAFCASLSQKDDESRISARKNALAALGSILQSLGEKDGKQSGF